MMAKNKVDTEPIFTLRGMDQFAPLAIERWADQVERYHGTTPETSKAREVARDMRTYREQQLSNQSNR